MVDERLNVRFRQQREQAREQWKARCIIDNDAQRRPMT
jgi:hypothetical protein